MAKRLLLATRNDGKVRELRTLLSDLPLMLIDLGQVGLVNDVAETGETFAENAVLKASGYAVQTGLLALAHNVSMNRSPGTTSVR